MTELLQQLLGSRPCDCGGCHAVATRRVRVTPRPEEAVAAELGGRPALLLGDRNTLAACGERLAQQLCHLGARVDVLDLSDGNRSPRADDATVQRVAARLRESPAATVPLAAGAGTINDAVKAAAHELGRRYVSVATAPSMNGYTSAIAAITVRGLKSTLPSTPPLAIVAEPRVLTQCPWRLKVAGLADLLSKPVSSADWSLTHLLWGDPYCPFPARLAGQAVEDAVAVAPRLRAGDATAARVLFEALLLSGISMNVAGSSSPASGGEHLISHFLDMTAGTAPGGPRDPALHGEQVGVGTRVTTRLYRRLLSSTAAEIDWQHATRNAPTLDAVRRRLDRVPRLPAALTERFVEQARRKLERIGPPAARVGRIREQWERVRGRLLPAVDDAEHKQDVLQRIGAAATARQIGAAPEELAQAYRLARWIRDRYTVLDLADDLGLLGQLESEVLQGL